MIDELLDMFGRKKKASGAKPGGLGGILSRVQDVVEGEDDDRRSSDRRRVTDRRFDRDDDRDEYRGRRRERDGFDLGDD